MTSVKFQQVQQTIATDGAPHSDGQAKARARERTAEEE